MMIDASLRNANKNAKDHALLTVEVSEIIITSKCNVIQA